MGRIRGRQLSAVVLSQVPKCEGPEPPVICGKAVRAVPDRGGVIQVFWQSGR